MSLMRRETWITDFQGAMLLLGSSASQLFPDPPNPTDMHKTTYEDAVLIARILGMNSDMVWSIIQGMSYHYYAELKIAVLNSPPRGLAYVLRFDA
jgi:hypothetical protein